MASESASDDFESEVPQTDAPASKPISPSDVYLAETASDEVAPSRSAPPHPHLGWAVLWMIAFLIIQVGVSFVVGFVAVVVAVSKGQTSQEQLEQATASASVTLIPFLTLVSVLTAIAIAAICFRREFFSKLALRGMAWVHWIVSLLLVLPLAVLASEVTNCASEFLPHFNAELLGNFAESPWPLIFVAACLFPAIGEEVFCRGFLGRGLVANHGTIAGVILASLLFGIMHIDPVQSVGAAVLGLGLHYIYLTTRSLMAPMLVHMLNNTFAFWVMRNYEWCPLPGLSPLPNGEQVHTPLSVMLAAVVASVALLTLLYQTRTTWRRPTSEANSDTDGKWCPGYPTAECPPRDSGYHSVTPWPELWLVGFVLLSYSALVIAIVMSSQAAVAS